MPSIESPAMQPLAKSPFARLFLGILLALQPASLFGQEAPPPPAQAPEKPATAPPVADTAPADPNKPAAAEFNRQFGEWKNLLKEMRQLKVQYLSTPDNEQQALEDQWKALVAKGNGMLADLTAAGVKAYEEAPNEDPQLTRFLVKLVVDSADRDEYEQTIAVAKVLIDGNCGDTSIYGPAALAAFALNDFDQSAAWNKLAIEAGTPAKAMVNWGIDPLAFKELWEKEQGIRAKEAEADDLPRVKVSTTKGDIVIELFENEAPDTVGNFISLVESGFFKDTPFHRVLKNFMAQGGDPTGSGSGGPGYQIYCECYRDDYRRHFRGTLSMAHAGKDTGGSQFFLTFLPTPHLNGKHTAFGRVIEGMDVLAKLQRIDPEDTTEAMPDKILGAEVLRKRDHAYLPKKVE
jgi:cyclophilin family peptidyl-prolyl cis-trans isomerase